VHLVGVLGLLQRLELPVGIAPLVLPDGDGQRLQLALLLRVTLARYSASPFS